MNCSKCGKKNPPGSRFCQYCGHEVLATTPMETRSALPSPASGESADSFEAQLPIERPSAALQGAGASVPTMGSVRSGPIRQMDGTTRGAAGWWGPFAGYGQRGHHASWLLDDLAEKADELHQTINQRFKQREISYSGGWRKLTGQGVGVEKRSFYLIRRGITTVALYIGQFGRDLYISQVTYAKGPISNVRAIIVGAMVAFQLFYMYGYTTAVGGMIGSYATLLGGGPEIGSILLMLCVVGPLGFVNSILLALLLFYSVYKWMKEKDLLAPLRVPPNEFQLDDIIALEKSVEETVRQALDEVGIDTALMPPAPEYAYRPRLF